MKNHGMAMKKTQNGTELLMNSKSQKINVILLLIIAITVIAIIISLYRLNNSISSTDNKDSVKMSTVSEDITAKYYIPSDDIKNTYAIPMDIEVNISDLRKNINEDIYSYIYIPNTNIAGPVLQHPDDISFYFTHSSEGKESGNGAIFTQFLNGTDYSDNNTVIYGRSGEGNPFDSLAAYKDGVFFQNSPYIYIYNSGYIFIYRIYASYEFCDKHLLMYYNVSDDMQFQSYLDEIAEYTTLKGNINKEIWPDSSDKIITLETDVADRDDKRYIVQAKLMAITDQLEE